MKKELMLLDVDLSLFDGEGGAPAGGADGGVATATGGKEQAPKVIYGNQQVDGQEGEQGGSEGEKKPGSKDPSTSFEDLIKGEYKEQFDKRVQEIINKRFKETKGIEKQLAETSPILDVLKRKYGADDAKTIHERLEAEFIEEMAYQHEMTPDNYRKILHAERIEQERLQEQQETIQQQQIIESVGRWQQQADAMKDEYPDFNLRDAMQNDKFVDLLKANIDVKTAYELLDFDNLKSGIAKDAQSQVTANIQSKQARPREAAGRGSSGVVVKSDVSSLTRADRAEIARRAQRGEKISFG